MLRIATTLSARLKGGRYKIGPVFSSHTDSLAPNGSEHQLPHMLFSLWILIRTTTNPHRLKAVLLRTVHSTQSAMKIFVSCGALPLRFEAQTRRLPSEENIGKASKSG
jgi:hypothetical protein